MGAGSGAGTGRGGGEIVPSIYPARRARLALAAAALAIDIGLGVLAATDAHAAGGVAWFGVAASAGVLLVGLLVESTVGVQIAVALLALLLLLRAQDRLLLAPLYGGGALAVSELAQNALVLRDVDGIAAEAVSARAFSILLVAATGMATATVTAALVLTAPARSVGLTAAGAVAVVVAMVLVLRLARRLGG